MGVHNRVSVVNSHRIISVFFLNLLDILSDFIKGLLPTDAFPSTLSTLNRMPETIRIFVKILEGCCFGANTALTKDIVFVPPDRQDLFSLNTNFNPTHRLTDIA